MTTVCKRRVIFGQFVSFFVWDNDKMGQRIANPTDAVDWAGISNYLLSTNSLPTFAIVIILQICSARANSSCPVNLNTRTLILYQD